MAAGGGDAAGAALTEDTADLQDEPDHEVGAGDDESTDQNQELPPPVLIALGLDIRLTVDDLACLSPEQIKAFFEAAGTLAAVQKNRG